MKGMNIPSFLSPVSFLSTTHHNQIRRVIVENIRVEIAGLKVARVLYNMVVDEALPRTEVDPSNFWHGLARAVADLGPRNLAAANVWKKSAPMPLASPMGPDNHGSLPSLCGRNGHRLRNVRLSRPFRPLAGSALHGPRASLRSSLGWALATLQAALSSNRKLPFNSPIDFPFLP